MIIKTGCSLLLLSFVIYAAPVNAQLAVEGTDEFIVKVESTLSDANRSSAHLGTLIIFIERCSSTITIRPITDDQATWHRSADRSRSHTEALDKKRRGEKRDSATDSVIYINTDRITKSHKTYSSGVLIHELVHAFDLANGTYHYSYPIREKRAIFFQNIWRDTHSRNLRTHYHGRFETGEYQTSKKAGRVAQFVRHFWEHSDIP